MAPLQQNSSLLYMYHYFNGKIDSVVIALPVKIKL